VLAPIDLSFGEKISCRQPEIQDLGTSAFSGKDVAGSNAGLMQEEMTVVDFVAEKT